MQVRRVLTGTLRRTGWERLRRLRRGLDGGIAAAAVVLVCCGVVFGLVEAGRNDEISGVRSGLEWVLLTLLTQSSPTDVVTTTGRVVYWLVLAVGVGIIAMATGAIASKLVEYVLRRSSGMTRYTGSGHIIICGWSTKGHEILRELHADEVDDKRHVVILAPLDSSPTRDPRTTFVHGSATSNEDLERAGIARADTAIVLADHSTPGTTSDDMDARTLLTTLAVESANPSCYTCVEVIRSENRVHFQRTKADELVVSAELTGALLASSAVTHGLSRIVTDLITHPEGNEFYATPAPPEIVGLPFAEALLELKRSYDCVVVGLSRRDEPGYDLNPDGSAVVEPDHVVLVIGSTAPTAPAARGVRARAAARP